MEQQNTRRLAAVVAADVVGYSRLMALDEDGTILAVRQLHDETIVPVVKGADGRIVKTMGDGFLIEFGSVRAAVEAATTIQSLLTAPQSPSVAGDVLQMRVGVHVGDVVHSGGDIFGEGVNLAARIEPLCQPGGVAVSEDAYRQVRDRLELDWVDGGTHAVKNIERPVQIWLWHPGGALPAAHASAAPEVPDKPSIAVLPFDNMSGDPDQEHFADGMTEDLITDLSKISGLFVVARNSTFAFKGQSVDVPTVARQLGVRHVLEGSIRRRGDKVRINIQLIEGEQGGHVWADRFDGPVADVFELQDEVCAQVVDALSVRLTGDEAARVAEVHTHNIEAYEVFVQAKATPYPPIPERIMAARKMFERVIELDPGFAGGHAGVSWMISFGTLWGNMDPVAPGQQAELLARRALAADANFGWAHTALGLSLLAQRDYDGALAAGARGVALWPNDADAHLFVALINVFVGAYDTALAAVQQAHRLNPHFINGPYLNLMAHVHFMRGDYSAAVDALDQNVARGGPVGPPALAWAAASNYLLGNTDAHAAALETLKSRWPNFRLEGWNFLSLLKSAEARERYATILLDSGLPK